jgi:hypothetical protein
MSQTGSSNLTSIAALSEFCSKNIFATHPDNPLNKSELDWLFKNRNSNGFTEAFVKVTSRNFLVHIPTFTKCLANRRGA